MKIRRRHNALTYALEKPILDAIAKNIHPYVTADQLSLLGLLGALIAGVSYILASSNLNFLHLVNFGIIIQWFGDSLDGRVARLRAESRPNLGHYLDHILDAGSLVIVVFGLGYSGLTIQTSWVWVLALYLLIMIHSFLKASVTGIFELTIERFGPTEARIGFILVNILVFATGNPIVVTSPFLANVFDVAGSIAATALLVNFIRAFTTTVWGKSRIRET